MKSKKLAVILLCLLVGMLNSAFVPAMEDVPGHDVRVKQCVEEYQREAAIDIPSHWSDYQLSRQVNDCVKSGKLVLVPVTGVTTVGGVATERQQVTTYEDFKMKQIERMLDGEVEQQPVTTYQDFKMKQIERMLDGE